MTMKAPRFFYGSFSPAPLLLAGCLLLLILGASPASSAPSPDASDPSLNSRGELKIKIQKGPAVPSSAVKAVNIIAFRKPNVGDFVQFKTVNRKGGPLRVRTKVDIYEIDKVKEKIKEVKIAEGLENEQDDVHIIYLEYFNPKHTMELGLKNKYILDIENVAGNQ